MFFLNPFRGRTARKRRAPCWLFIGLKILLFACCFVNLRNMNEETAKTLLRALDEYKALGIADQIDYKKFYLYSIITHSTAIEGSTVTEVENQLLFDHGIAASGRPMVEQLMNLDLKAAYEQAMRLAASHTPFSQEMLRGLSALVMKNTGSRYSVMAGEFDSSKGDLRKVNVTAGLGGKSYLNYQKVPARLTAFCESMNRRRGQLLRTGDMVEQYCLSFDAHNQLVAIHPWVDGNGRMARLVMNYVQFEFGLVPAKVLSEDRAQYIQALVASREQQSLDPFRQFMLAVHSRNLLREIENFKQSMRDDVPFAEEPVAFVVKDVAKEVLRILRQQPSATAAVVASRVGLSARQVQRVMASLRQQGQLRRVGGRKLGQWLVLGTGENLEK